MSSSPLARVTAAALAACGLLFLVGMVLAGGLDELDLLAPAVLLLGSAGLAASQLRWGPLPGSLISFGLTIVGPFFQDYSRYHLTHPEQFSLFAFTLLLHAFGVVATVAGAAAVWNNFADPGSAKHAADLRPRNYRDDKRAERPRLPGWAMFGVTGLGGAVAGALALAAALAGVGATAGTTPAGVLAGEAAVAARFVAEDLAFVEAPEQVDAGDVTIILRNDGALHHDIAFDGVNGSNPVSGSAPGATTSARLRLPPGAYVYFCTVPGHREAGMAGELLVDG